MKNIFQPQLPNPGTSYDEDFFDDMLGLFPDASGYAPRSGGCGKYLYEDGQWEDVIAHNASYYMPKAEQDLLAAVKKDVLACGVPAGLPYVDFGAGGKTSFLYNALGLIEAIGSTHYIGVDFCKKALREIRALTPLYQNQFAIKTEEMDLFLPTNKKLMQQPALGVMNGLTACNAYGLIKNGGMEANMVALLKYLTQLSGHGFLLLTIDTNQDANRLRQAYDTPLLRRFFLSVLFRMHNELPTVGFHPSLFVYDAEFKAEQQALAHVAVATQSQDFQLGPYPIHVEKGQKIHLLNSYKPRGDFFEACCTKANLAVVKHWDHETGMAMYLLKDNACALSLPVPAALKDCHTLAAAAKNTMPSRKGFNERAQA